jgi:hypothetical protein
MNLCKGVTRENENRNAQQNLTGLIDGGWFSEWSRDPICRNHARFGAAQYLRIQVIDPYGFPRFVRVFAW